MRKRVAPLAVNSRVKVVKDSFSFFFFLMVFTAALTLGMACRSSSLTARARAISKVAHLGVGNRSMPAKSRGSGILQKQKDKWEAWKNANSKKYRTVKMTSFLLRSFRTFTLCISLYATGKAAGIAEYARDPREKEKSICRSLVMGQAWEVEDEATGKLKPPNVLPVKSWDHRRVERIGDRIIAATRSMIEDDISTALSTLKTLKKKYSSEGNDNKDGKRRQNREEEACMKNIDDLRAKLKMFKGKWTYIVVESPVPNAFVTDLAPRKIFVNQGLLKELKVSDDELALILGHEVR